MKRLFSALCLAAFFGVAAYGSDLKPRLISVEEIRPGMKGFGMTVFQGSKPERFEVEILGVLHGTPNPRQNLIIGRLSGPLVDRTGVFAGMSGSPIYVDDRLVGALAYAFPFAKEPIAGITPIHQMIDIFERAGEEEPKSGKRASFNTLMSSASTSPGAQMTAQVSASAAANPALVPYVGQTITPIATPLSFSGMPQSVIDLYAEDLKRVGIQPIGGVGGGSNLDPMVPSNDDTLSPGSSVSVQLVRGDFTLDASGTVTYRNDDRIYAFGHPFLSSGQTSWPMAESSVVTVVPNLNNSFKLATGGNLVGSINQDRSSGIFGRLGDKPSMVPVRLTVHTSRNKNETYKFELVSDPFLTPLLMKIATFSAIAATERQIGSQTIKLNGRVTIDGQPDVILDNTFSMPNGAVFVAVASVERPLAALLNSGFEAVSLKGIELDVSSLDSRASGTLSRLWIDKTEVRPGESVEIQAFARNDNGSEFVERVALVIPQDAPVGPLTIIIGDGASINQTERVAQAAADFVPKDLGQLVRAINKLKKNNRLYIKVMRQGTGAVVNNEEMPTLPPSVLATLGSARTSGGYAPLNVATLAEHELAPSRFIISGQQSITINVIK